MTDDERIALDRLRRAPSTVQSLVPEIEVDRRIHTAMERFRVEWKNEWIQNVDRKAIDVASATANEAASGSRRRFYFAMVCIVLLAGRAIYDHVYGHTNRERIERVERVLDERARRLEHLEDATGAAR